MTEDQESKCHKIIHSHAVAGAAGNAVPVPGLGIATDMVTMTTMTMSLCAVFGGSLTEEAANQNSYERVIEINSFSWAGGCTKYYGNNA